jgi:rRNA methylases
LFYNGRMEKPVITSLSNPLIKQARMLRQRKFRSETGLFLVEGIYHVGEVIEAQWHVETILYAPELLTSNFARELLTRLKTQPQPVSTHVMESLADKENPQGIVAIVHQRKVQLEDLQVIRSGVALVAPQDPGNVGTILRTLDAVDSDVLFLLNGGVDLYHPSVVRASMGMLFWKPVIQTSFNEFLDWARSSIPGGIQLIGTSARGDVDYHALVTQEPWVLVLGNEQKGLSPEQAKVCNMTVSVPMKGRVSSLNLSVAAGVLLYQLMK